MKDILAVVTQILRRNPTLRRYGNGLGFFCLGMLFQERFWRAINTSTEAFGVSDKAWHGILWGVASLFGVGIGGVSLWLSHTMTADDYRAIGDKVESKTADKANGSQTPPDGALPAAG